MSPAFVTQSASGGEGDLQESLLRACPPLPVTQSAVEVKVSSLGSGG